MPPEQERMANPYGMDPSCTRCPELVETRSTIVHGYGDVAADFLFVAEMPTHETDRAGHPVVETDGDRSLGDLLAAVGFLRDDTDADGHPVLENAFVTHLTRCHHPDRGPTNEEIAACEPFLNAELRTINPELLIPLGERTVKSLAREYTTTNPDDLTLEEIHASEVCGRGFELIPLREPGNMDREDFEAAVERLSATLERDYRQTKGRRRR